MEAFLLYIGISPANLFAGFTGGLLAALVLSGPRPNLWAIFCSVVIGAGTAAYLGPIIPTWIGIKPSAGASFGVGLAGMPICKGIIAGAQRVRWVPPGQQNGSK
jgi:hypothetical protein